MTPIGSTSSNIRRAIEFILLLLRQARRPLRALTITWTTARRQIHRTTTPDGSPEGRCPEVTPNRARRNADRAVGSPFARRMVARWPVAAAHAKARRERACIERNRALLGRPESSVAKQADEWQYAMIAGFG